MDRRSFLGHGALATGLVLGRGLDLLSEDVKNASATPPVDTNSGKIRGYIQNVGSKKVYTFKGVPYGASTAGKRRFMPPEKPQAWTAVKETVEYGPRCPQSRGGGGGLVPEVDVMEWKGPMSEDCLNLNVWTPGLKGADKRPVMVWFHGGGYDRGSANFSQYDGRNLAGKHDVVMVGVNHRLNIFGYLYMPEYGGEKFAHSGNQGLQDLVLALQWVRDNIENFGGDPNRVTIFGQSGGGAKVSALMGMPGAKGLFHRAIAMSGSQVTAMERDDASRNLNNVLRALNMYATQIGKLQDLSMEELMDLSVRRYPLNGDRPLRWGPAIDAITLPKSPFDPAASEYSETVPMMIGSTETEITWNANQSYDPLDDQALHKKMKEALRADDAATDRVIAVYKKNRPKASNLDLYLIAASDAGQMRLGPALEAERKVMQGKAPVYKYYFQWYSPVRGGQLRAMHTMDIPFAMDIVEISKSEVGTGKEQQPLADKMSAAFVSFAATGKPATKLLPEWPAFNLETRQTMVFNNECKVVNDPYREERLAIEAASKGTGLAG
jgi:para-nitrobenzyl esterase